MLHLPHPSPIWAQGWMRLGSLGSLVMSTQGSRVLPRLGLWELLRPPHPSPMWAQGWMRLVSLGSLVGSMQGFRMAPLIMKKGVGQAPRRCRRLREWKILLHRLSRVRSSILQSRRWVPDARTVTAFKG